MPADRAERPYDLVLLGATGFTGGLTAEYLARRLAGAGTRWALAGRNRGRLEALRERLAAIEPGCAEVPLLHADVGDEGSLREVAASARVVATSVGPYTLYGEPLVAACAGAGTDYADLTGEPEFVDRMYLRHHARAIETGARLVHCCGFDSIPADLGVYHTVQQLPAGVPIRIAGYLRTRGTFSGGTAHSALTALSRGRQTRQAAGERRRVDTDPPGRRLRAGPGRPGYSRGLGGWVLPLSVIDPLVVRRSAAALERYGPDFSYTHQMVVRRTLAAAGMAGGAAGLFALTQIPPVRDFLLGRVRPGEGPSAERRARSWFKIRFVGEGGGTRVITGVSGGDPGYGETAKMFAESALCLAFDELPETAGQVTPAVAMGDALTERLRAAGIAFTVHQR
jgi:short subunit dehydrogenase-like uncharacterized protein